MLPPRLLLYGLFVSAMISGRDLIRALDAKQEEAHRLRLALLADPKLAYVTYCRAPVDRPGPCAVRLRRKITKQEWRDICSLPFSPAARWYQVELACHPLGQLTGPLVAKTRIWR